MAVKQAKYDPRDFGECPLCFAGASEIFVLTGIVWCLCRDCAVRWRAAVHVDTRLDRDVKAFRRALLLLARCEEIDTTRLESFESAVNILATKSDAKRRRQ